METVTTRVGMNVSMCLGTNVPTRLLMNFATAQRFLSPECVLVTL